MNKIKKQNKTSAILLIIFTLVLLPSLPNVLVGNDNESTTGEQGLHTSAVGIVRPDADIQTPWSTATPHYNKLDECEDESDPVDSSYVTANSGDHGEIEIFSIDDSIQPVTSVSQVKVHTYGRSFGNTNPKISILWNGGWTDWQTVNIPRSPMPGPLSPGWTVNIFTVSGDQSDLYNLQVRYQAQCTGWFYIPPYYSIPIGSNTLGAFFCEVTYEYYPAPQIITPEPINYSSPMEGYYPATYGFENDAHGAKGTEVSILDEWTGNHDSYLRMYVVDGPYDGHEKVFVIFDSQGGGITTGVHNFDNPQSSGTIEFWLRMEGASEVGSTDRFHEIYFRRSDNTIAFRAQLKMLEGGWVSGDRADVAYYDGNGWVEFADGEDLIWYRHRIDFDCTSGTSGKYSWYIYRSDGTLLASINDIDFENSMGTLDEIYFTSITSHYRGASYWDAFGFNWENNYNIGDNFREGLLLDFEPEDYTSMSYSLDAQPYISILGDTVIPMPDLGQHSIQVNGDGYLSELRTFTIIPPTIEIYSPEEGQVYDTGIYPASYSFDGDTIEESPSGWYIDAPSFTEAIVIEEKESHKNVVQISDAWTNSLAMSQALPNLEEGYVEFFVRLTWYRRFYIQIGQDTSANSIYLYFGGDPMFGYKIVVVDNDGSHDTLGYETNRWHHIKIGFICSLGWWWFYIDGISSGIFDFKGDPEYMNFIKFATPGSELGGEYFLDAIGYSWDPGYNTGDNQRPGLILNYTPSDFDSSSYFLDGDPDYMPSPTLSSVTYIPLITYGSHTLQLIGQKSGIDFESDEISFICEEGAPPIDGFVEYGELVEGNIEDLYWPDLSYLVIEDEITMFGDPLGQQGSYYYYYHTVHLLFKINDGHYSKFRIKWHWSTHDHNAQGQIIYDETTLAYDYVIKEGDFEYELVPSYTVQWMWIRLGQQQDYLEDRKYMYIDFITFYPV